MSFVNISFRNLFFIEVTALSFLMRKIIALSCFFEMILFSNVSSSKGYLKSLCGFLDLSF